MVISTIKIKFQNAAMTRFNSLSTSYPFGMVMPGRSFTSESYRYGFNGMEKDGEAWTGNDGSHLDFGARIYDSRLGKFLSIDPLSYKFPQTSHYSFADNNPILLIDKQGENPLVFILAFLETNKLLAKVTNTSISYTVSVQAKAGAVFVGGGFTDNIGIAVDPQGNYAVMTSLGAFIHLFDLGFNINNGGEYQNGDKNDGPMEGGSWFAGIDISLSFDIGAYDGYDNVADFRNESSTLSFETPIASLSFVNDQGKQVQNGMVFSIGPGISVGFGATDTRSVVFGFHDDDFMQIGKAVSLAKYNYSKMLIKGYQGVKIVTEYLSEKGDNGEITTTMSYVLQGTNKEGKIEKQVFEVIKIVNVDGYYFRTGNTKTKGEGGDE